MYDIKPLEEDWKKYQYKKRKPWYLFIALLFLILGMYMFNASITKVNIFDTIYNKINMFSTVSTKSNIDTPKYDILVNNSLARLETLEQNKIEANPIVDILVDIPILDNRIRPVSKSDKSENERAKVHLDIIETTSITAYEDVEKRFKQSRDIDDALFLAKSYYKKGNYEKSEYWALETNKLDSSIEESFFIFVKSKKHLGKKNEAVSILNSYLKRTNSRDARILLEQLEK